MCDSTNNYCSTNILIQPDQKFLLTSVQDAAVLISLTGTPKILPLFPRKLFKVGVLAIVQEHLLSLRQAQPEVLSQSGFH